MVCIYLTFFATRKTVVASSPPRTSHGGCQNFMNLAVGHDARQPLPGPPAAAEALRQKALALMEEWNGAHGDLYKGLRAAYRFLREGKRMKFPELQVKKRRGGKGRGRGRCGNWCEGAGGGPRANQGTVEV